MNIRTLLCQRFLGFLTMRCRDGRDLDVFVSRPWLSLVANRHPGGSVNQMAHGNIR